MKSYYASDLLNWPYKEKSRTVAVKSAMEKLQSMVHIFTKIYEFVKTFWTFTFLQYLSCHNYRARCLSRSSNFLFHLIIFKFESQLTPYIRIRFQLRSLVGQFHSQSPHEIGSYLGGFCSEAHEGTTPSTQLKLSPATISRIQAKYVRLPLTEEERH